MTAEKIPVRTYGTQKNSAPVVVLHGGPGAPGSVASLARALSHDFFVLEPLQRLAGDVLLSVEQHVNDLDQVCPDGAVIVGWSWGAMLGLSFVARRPGKVACLILVGCGTYDEESRKLIRPAVIQRLDEKGRERLTLLTQFFKDADSAEKQAAQLKEIGNLIAGASTYEYAAESFSDDEELPVDAVGHKQTWDDVLLLQKKKIEPEIFAAIKIPVLLIHGDTDPHPGRNIQDTLKKYIPQLEYVELEKCGHEPWKEKYAREEFLNLLTEWINKNSSVGDKLSPTRT